MAPPSRKKRGPTWARPPQILVVDDDASILDLLKHYLNGAGYGVRVAGDAMEAGRMLIEHVPDLLLVDIDMPYMNGFDFVSALQADDTLPVIPVVFISGHSQYAQRAADMGFDFLHKPLHKDKLLNAVAKYTAKA
jgi:chemosensory pili system protein ChpA (sensor histidine kinase/response regulator)